MRVVCVGASLTQLNKYIVAFVCLQLRKLLDTEASISLEAKAALEEAQGALATAKAEAAQQLAKLRRDLDCR